LPNEKVSTGVQTVDFDAEIDKTVYLVLEEAKQQLPDLSLSMSRESIVSFVDKSNFSLFLTIL